MPRILFYGGLACCILGAMLAASEALGLLFGHRFGASLVLLPAGQMTGGVVLSLATLLVAVPVFSLFVRMGSLLAARNLFASFFSLISSACATLGLIFVAVVQLRFAILRTTADAEGALESVAELNLSAFYIFGWFLSLALLALRPYFMVQSSRFLSWMVCLPLPMFILYVTQQVASGPGASSHLFAAFYFLSVALLLVAIPVHSIRHRYLFLEATNLREILDSRIDPVGAKGSFRLRGDVAFDS
jgi:hypothetical protein